MKHLLTAFGLIALAATVSAQSLVSQKTVGGNGNERIRGMVKDPDGGYTVALNTYSKDGDGLGNKGSQDVVFAKYNANNVQMWRKIYGGKQDEAILDLIRTADGGYMAVGWSTSTDSTLAGVTKRGEEDVWAIKMDATGTIQWQKCYGGPKIDVGTDVLELPNGGGYVITATVNTFLGSPIGGDVTQHFGGYDTWILRINATGTLVWQKSYGGNGDDGFLWEPRFVFAADGDIVLLINSSSTNMFFGAPYGGSSSDWVVAKLALADGSVVWQKRFGSTGEERTATIINTPDGGFLCTGSTSTATGNNDVPNVKSSSPDWLSIKIDALGNKQWAKTYGTTEFDYCNTAIAAPEGGYLLAGVIYGGNGDATNSGYRDIGDWWLVRTDSVGTILWQKAFGSLDQDEPNVLVAESNGNYLVAGYQSAASGDVTQNLGLRDGWVMRVKDRRVAVQDFIEGTGLTLSPNPATRLVNIDLQKSINTTARISNHLGQIIWQQAVEKGQTQLAVDVSNWATGIYIVKMDGYTEGSKFVKQ